MKNDFKAVANRLKLVRGARMLTEHDAALIADVTVRTWRVWESGKRWPHSSYHLTRFCLALDVSFDWLFYGETIEQIRARVGPLTMDVNPEVKAQHRAKVDQIVRVASQVTATLN